METDNFEDLLDDQGGPTRELDRWIDENICNVEDASIVPHYTTGEGFQTIWDIAKDYFGRPIALIRGHKKYRLVTGGDYHTAFEVDRWGIGQNKRMKNEAVAISNAFYESETD